MTELWTVGHGTRPVEAFIGALRAHGIQVLADVRHFPGSKRNPQYRQGPMKEALEQAGIRYVHLVDLGGFRKGGYEAYMATPEWQAAFAQLAALAGEARVAVCCAETVFFRCHRRFIADHAASRGWKVTHILDAKRTMPQRTVRQAKLETEGSWSLKSVGGVVVTTRSSQPNPEPPWPPTPGPFPDDPGDPDDDDDDD